MSGFTCTTKDTQPPAVVELANEGSGSVAIFVERGETREYVAVLKSGGTLDLYPLNEDMAKELGLQTETRDGMGKKRYIRVTA